MMTLTKKIDALNIGLLLISLALAFLLPFELFLFSYAILGPLHYLTEIGWLKEKKFFTPKSYDVWWLVSIAVLITIASFLPDDAWIQSFNLVFIGFAFTFVIFLVQSATSRLLIMLGLFILSSLLRDLTSFELIFAIFFPTLIHVFIFTAAFMLFGALKSRSILGGLGFMLLIICGLMLFWVDLPYHNLLSWSYIQESYQDFFLVNQYLIDLLGFEQSDSTLNTVYFSSIGVKVMRFVAFAYTYHYLNWFSKTSIIKWHHVPKAYVMSAIIIWIMSVGLYIYDFQIGLRWLLLLSFLHVLLEFPLNILSFKGIGTETKKILFKKAQSS